MNFKNTDAKYLANMIRQLRIRNDLSQEKMSNIIDCNRPTYSLWENNKRTIPLKYLNRISNKFNINIDYLVGLSNKKNVNHNNKEVNYIEIGKKITIAREYINLTQQTLAEKLNTTHSAISAYENGKTKIPTLFLIEIAKVTNNSLNWFIGKNK